MPPLLRLSDDGIARLTSDDVWRRLSVAYIGPKSRTKRSRDSIYIKFELRFQTEDGHLTNIGILQIQDGGRTPYW